ncbi:hypothetical protein PZA11_002190 [Diplocarpon coronariae]
MATSVIAHFETKRTIADTQRRAQLSKRCAPAVAASNEKRYAKRILQRKQAFEKRGNVTYTITTEAPYYNVIPNKQSCVFDPDAIEGPYYWPRADMLRQDITEDQDGIPLWLDIGVIDVATCKPVENALVDVWHANATGFLPGWYSGHKLAPQQNPLSSNTLRTGSDISASLAEVFKDDCKVPPILEPHTCVPYTLASSSTSPDQPADQRSPSSTGSPVSPTNTSESLSSELRRALSVEEASTAPTSAHPRQLEFDVMAPNEPPVPLMGTTLPKYELSGRFTGAEGNASRWLNRLQYDFKSAGYTTPDPEMFFEAIDILFEGQAAEWLDSSAEFRAIIDEKENATVDHVANFKQALKAEYPTKVADHTENNIQYDIKNLAQNPDESLAAYYQRTTHLLRRAHGKDAGRLTTSPALSSIEQVVLDSIIAAFIEGIHDDELRVAALSKSALSSGALWKALDVVKDAQNTLNTTREMEQRRQEKFETEQLRQLCHKQYGMSASAVLSLLNAGKPVVPVNQKSSPYALRSTPPVELHGNLPLHSTTTNRNGNQNGRGALQETNNAQNVQQANTNPDWRARQNTKAYAVPPRSQSLHPVINGSKTYDSKKDGVLCVRCGDFGHKATECTGNELAAWEKAYLRQAIWGGNVGSYLANITGTSKYNKSPSAKAEEGSEESSSSNQRHEAPSNQVSFDDYVKALASNNCSLGTLSLDSKMAGRPKKRPRMSIEELMNSSDDEPMPTPTTKPAGKASNKPADKKASEPIDDDATTDAEKVARKKGKRAVRYLREIVAREGMGPMNYQELADRIKVPLSLTEFFQVSPEGSKEFRRLSTRKNHKSSKKEGKSVRFAAEARVSSDVRNTLKPIATVPLLSSEKKAFQIDCFIKMPDKNGSLVEVALPTHLTQVDQGSDMNVISHALVRKLKLKPIPLSERGFSGLTMNTADGGETELTHWVEFEVGTHGVWRKDEAFVRPFGADLHLLLGLPWLWKVDGTIDIRNSRITIGDSASGEKKVVIEGPKFVPSKHHKLFLHPVGILDPGLVSPRKSTEKPSIQNELESSSSESESDETDSSTDSGN